MFLTDEANPLTVLSVLNDGALHGAEFGRLFAIIEDFVNVSVGDDWSRNGDEVSSLECERASLDIDFDIMKTFIQADDARGNSGADASFAAESDVEISDQFGFLGVGARLVLGVVVDTSEATDVVCAGDETPFVGVAGGACTGGSGDTDGRVHDKAQISRVA